LPKHYFRITPPPRKLHEIAVWGIFLEGMLRARSERLEAVGGIAGKTLARLVESRVRVRVFHGSAEETPRSRFPINYLEWDGPARNDESKSGRCGFVVL